MLSSFRYRDFIKSAIGRAKERGEELTFQQLAEAMRVQKSYLSRVMADKAELSSDQIFLLAKFLRLNAKETEFLHTCLEWERSGLKERRTQLKEQLESLRKSLLESKEHINAPKIELDAAALQQYYLNPTMLIVHMAIAIPRYQTNVSLLAKDLRMAEADAERCLLKLVEMGLVEQRKNTFSPRIEALHLPRESPLYVPWRNALRALANGKLQFSNDQNAQSFHVLFSGDKEAAEKIWSDFLKFIQRTETTVRKAPCEDVYQLSFELIPWTH